tara:strand:+ start:18 stop:701 length:684 start_codon:yes stop_codon:yes gene_type:complete
MNEINRSFDEKQFFEVIIMRLCYVSLLPTPFELLKNGLNIDKENKKIDDSVMITPEKSELFKDSKKKNNNQTANQNNTPIVSNYKADSFSDMAKFKGLVDLIEKRSEMLISFHLKNSFKLVSLVDSNNFKEIELENISDNRDSKKILWKASKLLNEITNERWMISLSSKKGLKTLKDFESDIKKEEIEKIKNNTFVKKILETIPSSEVVSIKDLDNLETLKKKDYNE